MLWNRQLILVQSYDACTQSMLSALAIGKPRSPVPRESAELATTRNRYLRMALREVGREAAVNYERCHEKLHNDSCDTRQLRTAPRRYKCDLLLDLNCSSCICQSGAAQLWTEVAHGQAKHTIQNTIRPRPCDKTIFKINLRHTGSTGRQQGTIKRQQALRKQALTKSPTPVFRSSR